MATYKAAALLFLACFAFGIRANGLILTPKVVDCYGKGVKDVVITLGSFVNPISNNKGVPYNASTDGTGIATGFCSWTTTIPKVYNTVQNHIANGTISVTAHEASAHKCDGNNNRTETICYDSDEATPAAGPITFEDQNCPSSSPAPGPCPPSPEKCSQGGSSYVDITSLSDNIQDKEAPRKSNEIVRRPRGICNGNLELCKNCGQQPKHVCPRGDINSTQVCKDGKDYAVCDVAQTSMCAATQSGQCSKYGGQCMCRELQDGAACNTLPFPDIFETWDKHNRDPKCDDKGNMVDQWDKEVDFSQWKQGNWNGTRVQQSSEFDWAWSGHDKGFNDLDQDTGPLHHEQAATSTSPVPGGSMAIAEGCPPADHAPTNQPLEQSSLICKSRVPPAAEEATQEKGLMHILYPGTILYPWTILYPGAILYRGTVLYPGTILYPGTKPKCHSTLPNNCVSLLVQDSHLHSVKLPHGPVGWQTPTAVPSVRPLPWPPPCLMDFGQ